MLYGAIASSETRISQPGFVAANFLGLGGFNVDAFTINPIQFGSVNFAGAGNLSADASLTNRELAANFAGYGWLTADSFLRNPFWAGNAAFSGSGGLIADGFLTGDLIAANFAGSGNMAANISGQISKAFSQTLTSSSGNGAGYSNRGTHTVTVGGSKIRVKFTASNLSGFAVDNASIGIQSTTYNTTDTPVELLFGGGHGFAIGTNQTIWSDFADLETTANQVVIVVVDFSAGTSYTMYKANGPIRYYLAATDSYNQATPAGSWGSDLNSHAEMQIDVYNSI